MFEGWLKKTGCSIALMTTFSVSLTAQQPAKPQPSIKALFAEDQRDRANSMGISAADWQKIGARDLERRRLTRQLLASGVLQTGEDFRNASFIFQHGSDPKDYLLAHILAMTAMSKGDRSARWIAAATLDRYLQAIKQSQVFGTQYDTPETGPRDATQDPYDKNLLSDSLRKDSCVPSLAQQQSNVESLKRDKDLLVTDVCR